MVAVRRREQWHLPDSIFAALADGEAILLSARWLLARAGYVAYEVTLEGGMKVTAWRIEGEPAPLLTRQDMEATAPDGILTVSKLAEQYEAFKAVAAKTKSLDGCSTAGEDLVDALPLLSVSYCWERPEQPDPHQKTLRSIAARLASEWDGNGVPTSGLPLYELWGVKDAGVFVDWSSLYQDVKVANAPVKRTPDQNACFKRALENMGIWYGHRLVSTLVINNQQDRLFQYAPVDGGYGLDYRRQVDDKGEPVLMPRSNRGWPFFEEALSRLFKSSHRAYFISTSATDESIGVNAPMWPMVLEVKHSKRWSANETREDRSQRAPIRPALFRDQLSRKKFTNGKEDEPLCNELYAAAARDGFGGMTHLLFQNRGWGDSELDGLCLTLIEVSAPYVTRFDLSENEAITSVQQPFDELLEAGCLLAGLHELDLHGCASMAVLPTRFDEMLSLRKLNLAHCRSLQNFAGDLPPNLVELSLEGCCELQALPRTFGKLSRLEELDLEDCAKLDGLPHSMGKLRVLRKLLLWGCSTLTKMPDLSALTQLRLSRLPECIAGWETAGRKAWGYHPIELDIEAN